MFPTKKAAEENYAYRVTSCMKPMSRLDYLDRDKRYDSSR